MAAPTVYPKGSGSIQRDLNGMAPAANTARLGDLLNDIITALNALTSRLNTLVPLLVTAAGTNVPVITTVTAITAPVAVRTINANPGKPELTGDLP